MFHWYLGQRKNDRSGCLKADFAVALPRRGVGETAAAEGTGSSCPALAAWVMRL
jgi:hypothetical protein